jgi:hypothetical protein
MLSYIRNFNDCLILHYVITLHSSCDLELKSIEFAMKHFKILC